MIYKFQPTLPARGATHSVYGARVFGDISTHAPRTGSDSTNFSTDGNGKISTHAPRTGSDYNGNIKRGVAQYFNPRSPHGERPRNML